MWLKKIDVYIIKKYLSTFFFTMCLISLIAVAMNFFENVDKFLADDVKWFDVFFTYYLNFIPWINGLLWPLFALLAVIFFTSRMATDSEIIAALSSGMSYNRLLRPFVISGTIIAGLLWIGNNFVIPNSSRIKNEFESEFIRKGNKTTLSTDIHFYLSPNEKAYFRLFSSRDSIARNFRLERFKEGKLTYMLKTESLKFIDTLNKWRMTDYEEHSLNNLNEQMVIKKNIKKDTLFPFRPEDFIRYSKQMEMLTSIELRKFINQEQGKGLDGAKKYYIELYRRTADPFTIIILTIIGAAIASRKVRGGIGLHISLGIILGSIFVILSKFSVTFASNLSMPAGLGVWLPNIAFSLIAYYLYTKAQK
jgi:lipopolysaccharide export system permease protein